MKKISLGVATVLAVIMASTFATDHRVWATGGVTFSVIPFDFDPFKTRLVEAEWEDGIGCPTNATTRPFVESPPNSGNFVVGPPTPYTDPACPSGDPRDRQNVGLLLVKTGPTNNDASAGAILQGVKGVAITELGYDIRKPGILIADPRGSHCGAGAPRFNITIDNELYFIACASPPPDFDGPGIGWQRLRWGGSAPLFAYSQTTGLLTNITGQTVKSISIVFDEAQDAGGAPDQFGGAILDNIDVNGTLVGMGPETPENKDRDDSDGEDKDHRH